MGEVVVSSEEGMEMRWWKPKKDSSNSSDVVRWERLLPRMSLTVLLVEADDSTRQIITALLRKCGYRVTAVPDGLKAWETLKGRPHNIDLILTEVELPSISGFALLTLIMEHDICKNIPVIMMSSHDSISIVLKCMLKAAADFLIKPVRRNELRNLWQHVWRRHTPTGGHVPQNLAVAKQKVEATSENNAASNHSSDYVASIQKNKECSEKGSDAQSSCTTPCLEAESTYMQNMQGLSTLKCRCASNLSNMEIERREKRVKLDKESLVPESETGGKSIRLGPEVAPCNEAYDSTALRLEEDQSSAKTITRNEGVGPESQRGNANITDEIYGCNDEQIEPFRGAIDLIGTFDNRPKCTNGQLGSNDGTKKHIFAPHLELSLRRFHSSSSKNQGTDERHTLNHSNASAFSWYNNSKTLQPLFPTSANSCTQQKEGAINSQKQLSNQVSENTVGSPQWHGTASSNSQESMTTLVVGQSGQAEAAFPSPQVGIIPVPEIRFDSLRAGYGHIFPPIFYTQSGLPPVWSPKSACQREQSPFPMSSSLHSYPEVYNSEQGYCPLDETTNNSTDQTLHEQQNKLESVGELRHGSPAADQSVSSSLCNGVLSHLNSSVYGSICNRNDVNASQAAAVARVTTPESVNDEGLFSHDGLSGMDSHCSTQREAALSKFRLKRKDRCYEKKVRYQSRKRLAEQRPRIKGQFVRQVQADHPPAGVLVAPEIRYDHLLHCHQSEFSKLPRGRS